MRVDSKFLCYLLTFVAGLSTSNVAGQQAAILGKTISSGQIIAEGEKMADAQLDQLAGRKSHISWEAGVLWAGLADLSHISSKTAYADAIEGLGNNFQWTPRLQKNAPENADDLCISQTFLDAYVTKNDPARLAPTKNRLDAVCDYIENREIGDLPEIWWWCDALFMAPTSHARLTAITNDPKYLDAMDKEWWKTASLLYDKNEHLFYRDKRYIGQLTKNGKKVFWSRANGWVFAGLARTLSYMPRNYQSLPRYVTMFKEMAAKLATLQQPDGTWRSSLLDPDEYPDPETSGTSLDCFAYAWGINNGILDRATYLPIAAKAWIALLAARRPDGLLGYVQGRGIEPKGAKPDGTQIYATGAFLMAACQLSKLAPFTVPP